MKIETELRILDNEGHVVYRNTYAHEEADVIDPRVVLADYAVIAPNRTKKQVAAGLERYAAYMQEKAAEAARAAAAAEQARIEKRDSTSKRAGSGKQAARRKKTRAREVKGDAE